MNNQENKILVIDDEEEILEVLSLILTKEGYEVLTSSYGDSAFDIIRNNEISLVLCDLNLGEESGLSILKSMKIIKPDIQFIMITGFGSIDTAVEAMREGAFDFIEKPVRRHNIIKVVEKAFENIELVKENKLLKKQLLEKSSISVDSASKPALFDIKIGSTLEEIETQVLKQILAYTKDNKEVAAQILGIEIEIFNQKIEMLDLNNI
jgi:two-component system, NtrC family, response regulator HydG